MARVAIPGGVWAGGTAGAEEPRRELALRAVSGEDEVFLLESAEDAAPSARATELLSRCLSDPEMAAAVRTLTIGDREALLLHLRRLTLGETIDCVLGCPAEGCGERMELELDVADLLVPEYRDRRREYELAIEADGARYELTYRLPTADDLDRVAPVARRDPERGAAALAERCVVRVKHDDEHIDTARLTPAVRHALADAMAAHDPQAELELELSCPACGAAFSIVFDTASFFLQELDARASRLLQEVHTLASHYHWSERDILQMPWRRRARYLELVASSVAHAGAL